MNNTQTISLDTLNPADHAKALELALDTLEAVHETVEARGDERVAAMLKAILDDLGYLHYCALERAPAVNASGGEA